LLTDKLFMPEPGLIPPPAPPAHLHPRIVPWRHAFAWYEEAMRLFKFSPLQWIGLAVLTLVSELALTAIPTGGVLLGEILTPLVGCGLVYAAAAADRRVTPSLRLALSAFQAGAGAVAAIVGASLFSFAAQLFAAWWIADANLLVPESGLTELSTTTIFGIWAVSILASLPVAFVPLHVLLERVSPGAAFAASWNAFALNTLPLLVYGAAALGLLGLSLLTAGLGLILALPLSTASLYAGWKDIFGVRDAPDA
jgi:hypothetical protein